MSNIQWDVFSRSVQGARHKRSGQDNQDAVRIWTEEDLYILAVADGHGSPVNFRSKQGAELAVAVACDSLRVLRSDPPFSWKQLNGMAQEELPKRIANGWRKQVEEHLATNPFTDAERNTLSQRTTSEKQAQIEKDPVIAYGTTLLAVAITHQYLLYLQIGDGDILIVETDGTVSRPLPKAPTLIGDETTSLCSKQAWSHINIKCQMIGGDTGPRLIIVATDGYANSFRDEQSFLKVGSDIDQMIQEDRGAYVKQNLESWLDEASHLGSGDDITLGIIARMKDLPNTEGTLKDESDTSAGADGTGESA